MATVHLTEMADYDGMNQVWDAWLPEGSAPCRACVRVAGLAKSGLAGGDRAERGALAPDHRKSLERAGRHCVAAPPVHSHKLCKALIFFRVAPHCARMCGSPAAFDQVSAMTQRLREIPWQLHLLLRSRDRHPPARQRGLADRRRIAPGARHRPLGAHALRGAGRHLGGAAQPLPAGRPARQPGPSRGAGQGAAAPPGGSREAPPGIGRRRSRARGQGRAPGQGRLRGGGRFRAILRRHPGAAAQGAACAGSPHPQGQHLLRRPRPRLARDRRHRLARRVPLRGALPGHRGRWRRW